MRRDLTTTGLIALTLLAAIPSYDRVFAEATWRAPAVSAAAIALLLAALLRQVRRGGGLLVAIISLAAAISVLPWLLGLSPTPVVPRPAVLDPLAELWSIGMTELAETPAPAPSTAGLVLLTTTGWWFVAHVAHEIAVRLDRAGAALVAVTVLWAVPLAIEVPTGRRLIELVPFLVAGGLVLLASADEDARQTGDVPRLSAVGGAVGAVAVLVAVSAPWLLPGHDEPAWMSFGDGAAPRGYQPIVDVSNRLGQPEERDVLRVQSPQRNYLRLAGLDSFDGSTWRLGPPDGGSYSPDPDTLHPATELLPPEQPASSTRSFEVDVDVLELENIYVPLPYQPVEVLGPLRDEMVWSTDGGFLATWDTIEANGSPTIGVSEGTNYRVRVAQPNPGFSELEQVEFDDATLAEHTQLPREYPELGEQAEEIYEEAEATSVVEQALALQDWFVGPEGDFTYDLEVPALRGDDALTDFVLEDRTGYCEYFATAMAVMLRQTGIPARVAVGFLPGREAGADEAGIPGVDAPDSDDGLTEYIVSTGDAHAWVEVLFPGYGWVTFEPTPRSDDTHMVPTSDDLAPVENEAERRAADVADGLEDIDPVDPQVPDDQMEVPEGDLGDGQTDDEPGSAAGDGGTNWPWIVVVLAAFAVGGFAWSRRSRGPAGADPRQRVIAAQRDLLLTADRAGVGRRPPETTIEVLDRWRRDGRIHARHAAVGPRVQAAAFDGSIDDASAEEVAAVLQEAEEVLRGSVPRARRMTEPARQVAARLRGTVRRWRRAVTDRASR